MRTILQSEAEQQNAATYKVGDVLVYWVSDDRQGSFYLGRGADEAAAMQNARETIEDIDFDTDGGSLECMLVVADEDAHYIVEGCNKGHWASEYVEAGGSAEFATEAEAFAAIDSLVSTCGWSRDDLRVRRVVL